MASQTILWTALPNGVVNQQTVRLSVHIAPRLVAGGSPTLAKFKDWVAWPKTQVSFKVAFGGGAQLPATVVTSPEASSDRWTAIFDAGTPVKPFNPKSFFQSAWLSYPVANVVAFLQDLYVEMVTTYPADHPPTDVLRDIDRLGRLQFLSEDGQQRRTDAENYIHDSLGNDKAVPYTPYDPTVELNTVIDFLQVKQFHTPAGALLDAMTLPVFDFHDMLVMIGSHPWLQRLLGLVVDLEVVLGQNLPPKNSRVQVFPTWTPAADVTTKDISPATRCRIDPANGEFRAAPQAVDPELVGRSLPFGDTRKFRLVQVDPDGAAMKALMFADNLERQWMHRTIGTPDAEALPALRSGGLSVARLGRSALKPTAMKKVDDLNAVVAQGNNPTLDAEDVTRGYRMAVHDGARWRSLLARHGEYRFLKTGATETVDDEAVITSAPTRAADGSSNDMRIPESLFSWRGWSLAAPRPGADFDAPAPTIDPTGDVESIPNESQTAFQLETLLRPAPGSLPRLRFGTAYRVRARAVDIAGNSLPLDPSAPLDPTLDAGPVVYGRFEPVEAPFVLMTAPRTAGESVRRLVIRSDVGTQPDTATMRHIAPPKTSVQMSEQLGMLDLPAGPGDPSVIDPAAWALVWPIEAGSYFTSPQGMDDPDDYDKAPYFPTLSLDLQGLPDPFARSAVLAGLPGASQDVKVGFDPAAGKKWPAGRPFVLKLGGGSGAPSFEDSQRILSVELPQAETAVVRLSCMMDPADLLKMGVWRWVLDAGLVTPGLRALAESGRLCALSPYRDLVFVHAVRRPLLPIEFVDLETPRNPAETFATLTDYAQFHRKSTGKAEIRGAWPEYVDLGSGSPQVPAIVDATVAFPIPLDRDVEVFDTIRIDDRHEFGDTKHRDVTYEAIATSRFTEYFAQTAQPVLHAQDVNTLDTDGDGFVHGSVVVKSRPASPGERQVVYAEGVQVGSSPPAYDPPDADYVIDEPAGSIRRTESSRIASDQQVVVSYVVPPVTQTTSRPVLKDVPSSARPPAPKVLYVLPAFDWSRLDTRDGINSTRKGNLLRVYLDRPWFASGADEMLGVVLEPPSDLPLDPLPPSQLRPYVTQFGGDPIHGSLPITLPGLASFPFATQQAQGLVLDEAGPSYPVDVAAHPIDITDNFNQERGLWFCDLEVDAGPAYSPFVRLALARYQSHALPGLELSRVMLADFIQLAPDRFVTITFDASDPTKLTVAVTGLSTTKTDAGVGPGVAYVTVEHRDPRVATDLTWAAVGRPVKLTLQAGSGSVRTWSGTLTLPEPRTSGNLRLAIEQFEVWRTDGDPTGPKTKANRLVFTDLVEL